MSPSFVRTMENVRVFMTTVETSMGASRLAFALDHIVGVKKWNFDLDDCDRILRVAGDCRVEEVIHLLEASGYRCTELGDEVPGEQWLQDNRKAS